MTPDSKNADQRELIQRLRATEEAMARPGIDTEKAKDLLALHARLTAALEKLS